MIDTLKEPEATVAATFDVFKATVAGEAVPWLRALRGEAAVAASKLGFPTLTNEEWRFTNIAPLAKLALEPAAKSSPELTAKDIARFTFGLDCYQLVFIDGVFAERLSKLPPAGNSVTAGSLAVSIKSGAADVKKNLGAHAKVEDNYFAALNTAYFQDGAFVSIPSGKTADKPVHILFVGASEQPGATTFPRVLVVAGENSDLKVVESHVSLADEPRVACAVTELVLGRNARVEHCKIQQDSERAFHIATVQGVVAKDSNWMTHSIAVGSRIARNQIQALFAESGASATLNGLYLGHGEQLIDHHTVVDHAQPHCESHEYYHGILADRSHGVFNGKIFVRKDAQKTNAKQTNRNLLLSDNAAIDTKPQLEIYADDVKCTHGAAIGQLNEEAIFYLQARGIGKELARRMLIQAFANDVVERIGIEPIREALGQLLMDRFATDAK